MAGLLGSTGTSITVSTFAKVIAGRCLHAASVPSNSVRNSGVKRCTIREAAKLAVTVNSPLRKLFRFQLDQPGSKT